MSVPKILIASGFSRRSVQVLIEKRKNPVAHPDYDACLKAVSGYIGKGSLVAVIGDRWLGKTVMGTEVAAGVVENGGTVLYSTLNDFLLHISATWKKDNRVTELEVITKFRAPSLLVLDETGKSGGKSWEDRFVFELIDKRYCDMNDTILLSNHTKESFEAWLGPSLCRRMAETGKVLEAKWASFQKGGE